MMLFVVGRALGMARNGLNAFPLFEFLLRIKEPSRLPGKQIIVQSSEWTNKYSWHYFRPYTDTALSCSNTELSILTRELTYTVLVIIPLELSETNLRYFIQVVLKATPNENHNNAQAKTVTCIIRHHTPSVYHFSSKKIRK
jgi:hypothetical protein